VQHAEQLQALLPPRLGSFHDAEPGLRRALERYPDDLDVLKALGLGLAGSDRLAGAEPYLDRWCSLRPDDAEPYKQRMDLRHRRARQAAHAADRQQLMEDAVADGRRALELDPRGDDLAPEVVWLLTEVGRFDEADQLCRRCLRRQPDDPWLTYLLARIDHARGASAEARALLDALRERQPGFARALLLRAVLHNEDGEPDKAIPLLRQVLALDPTYGREAHYQLSLALARLGRADEARRAMAEVEKDNLATVLASANNRDTVGIKLQQAGVLLTTGGEDEACRLLTALLDQDPGCAAAHALLATYYERHGQLARAAEHRRRARQEEHPSR
jgi:tetratricopeptide (TPR) repeat protein